MTIQPEPKEFDTRYTDTVICPYCGYDNGDDDGDGPRTGEEQCQECEKKFHCEPDYSVSYITRKVPCLNGEPHQWRDNWGAFSKCCKHCLKIEWNKSEL